MQIFIYEVYLQILIYFIIYPHMLAYFHKADKDKFLCYFISRKPPILTFMSGTEI